MKVEYGITLSKTKANKIYSLLSNYQEVLIAQQQLHQLPVEDELDKISESIEFIRHW